MAAKWTFMVYMAGNNSLSEDAGIDLDEIRQVGSTADVKIVAFVKQEGTNARRLQVAKGAHDVVEDLGPAVDSGDPKTVVEFVRWAVRTAPAQRYAFVLWNHGGGWRAEDLDQLYSGAKGGEGVNRHELNKRATQRVGRAVFTPTVREILAQQADAREILADDTTGHSLDTIELQRVLHAATGEFGHAIDLLGMDACLMTTIEVAYEIRKEVGVIVGSEEEEPAEGWPYAEILGDLVAKPGMSALELANTIVERYVESYRSSNKNVTQCALDPSKTEAFASAVDGLERALRPVLDDKWLNVSGAQTKSTHFAADLVDLKMFCANLATAGLNKGVTAAAKGVLTALKPGGVVVTEAHHGKKVKDCGGVSVYFPQPTTAISKYYKDLQFAKRHRWDDFVRKFHQAVAAG